MSEIVQQNAKERSGRGSWWIEAGVLSVLCLVVRSVGLMVLPIFGDEAIYLRWAELVREGHWWVSLIDPKPPLHFWMIAGVMGWTRDPLLAARLISVAAGVLSVPAIMGACQEIARLAQPAVVSGRVLGLLAAVLMIFCPFASFYQRLATADALFVLEMLVVVWLALWWVRSEGRQGWWLAGALGVAMGATLMTRQGLSYTLCGVIAMAVVVNWSRGRLGMRMVQLAMAALIAVALWSPYLLADLPKRLEDAKEGNPQATEWTVIRQRIIYQEQFTAGQTNRVRTALRNASQTLLPFWFEPGENGRVRQEMGWLPGYMTWPVYALSVVGLVYLGVRKQWRVLAVVGCWAMMMLGPTLTLNVIYSRYVLAGAVVFLVPAAWVIADALALVTGWKGFGWIVAAMLLIGVLAPGMREVGLQSSRWWEQRLTERDRYQYVTGWSAGTAVNHAMDYLRKEAAGGPIVVITDDGWGLPADAVWDDLARTANVEVYYTSVSGTEKILLPATGGEPNSYLLRKDKWLYTPAQAVRLDPAAQVFFIRHVGADEDAVEKRLREFNPAMGQELIFNGMDKSGDKVVVFSVK